MEDFPEGLTRPAFIIHDQNPGRFLHRVFASKLSVNH
jgi:hypothetical protein